MKNFLRHAGFIARVTYDAEADSLVATVMETTPPIRVHSGTLSGLKDALQLAVDEHIAQCVQNGRSPARTYSGNVFLRVPPVLHEQMSTCARAEGMSLNQWALRALTLAANSVASSAPTSRRI